MTCDPTTRTATPTDGPRYAHDCDGCVFLGAFHDPVYGPCDLYFADHGGVAPEGYRPATATVIARYGDDGWEYTSGIVFRGQIPAVAEGVRLAAGRGLLRVPEGAS